MKGKFPVESFRKLRTPFYYYDTALLEQTLGELTGLLRQHPNFVMHYAVKANANPGVLSMIAAHGLGADCVSGGEIERAVKCGFSPENVVFAGVGKADWEIRLGLKLGIFCFNVESIPEMEVINSLVHEMSTKARICLRVNPDVGAHTHANITTGLAENKFGIALSDLDNAIDEALKMDSVKLIGLHFHIGSQILDMGDFSALCNRINDIQTHLEKRNIHLTNINVGGGLGVDYNHPNRVPIPDFKSYFSTYAHGLHLRPGQKLHFELGRAIVAQMGSLITQVLYVKQGTAKQFAIVDAGMTDLIRPALYNAYHKIENITSELPTETYDVVGPICESSDVFAKQIDLNGVKRGDLLAIRSAGAYGEIMASQYNCRPLPKGFMSNSLPITE